MTRLFFETFIPELKLRHIYIYITKENVEKTLRLDYPYKKNFNCAAIMIIYYILMNFFFQGGFRIGILTKFSI